MKLLQRLFQASGTGDEEVLVTAYLRGIPTEPITLRMCGKAIRGRGTSARGKGPSRGNPKDQAQTRDQVAVGKKKEKKEGKDLVTAVKLELGSAKTAVIVEVPSLVRRMLWGQDVDDVIALIEPFIRPQSQSQSRKEDQEKEEGYLRLQLRRNDFAHVDGNASGSPECKGDAGCECKVTLEIPFQAKWSSEDKNSTLAHTFVQFLESGDLEYREGEEDKDCGVVERGKKVWRKTVRSSATTWSALDAPRPSVLRKVTNHVVALVTRKK